MWQKLKDWFKALATDKKGHLIAGAVIAIVGGALTAPVWGVLLAIVAGGAKEWYDQHNGGVFDYRDWSYTAVGGLVAGAALGLFMKVPLLPAAIGSLIGR